MARLVGVVGSRSLPVSFSPLVASVVSLFLSQGFGVASGGALGADSFALSALLQLHGACPERAIASRGVVFSAWSSPLGFPASVRPLAAQLAGQGGRLLWGAASPGAPRSRVVSALLGRNQRLVSACSVLVAFLFGPSRGSLYTVRQAVSRGVPVIVFLCGGGAVLPPDLASRCFIFNSKGVI